jgi:hypothetical protein
LKKPRIEKTKSGHMTFKNYHKQHVLELTAFLDFECVLPTNEKMCQECSRLKCKCDKSFTEIVNDQYPISFCFIIVSNKNEIVHHYKYTGVNAAEHFLNHLLEQDRLWINPLFKSYEEMKLSEEQQKDFENTEVCYLCDDSFSTTTKVRDHNHFTGEYLGAACNDCNLLRRRQRLLTIYAHNGSKYDFHFIIKALTSAKRIKHIEVLPYNSEHFRTLLINRRYLFLDSLAFLQESLERLSDDLLKAKHSYPILSQSELVKTNGDIDERKLNMILRKSFFPYEYCTSLKKMKCTTELPDLEKFYSSLHEKNISEKDHQFAGKVWRTFICSTLLDYTEIYCEIDTLLLAEIFQKFRSDMHNFSGLDPAYYISLPSFAFDVLLFTTKASLPYIEDINIVHFIDSAIRGGLSFINTRQLIVENPVEEEIFYIDANVS